MSTLLLALALVAPGAAAADADRPDAAVSCSVNVNAFDDLGRVRPARRVSAGYAPALVFRGRVSRHADDAEAAALVFDVYTPRGQRYQVLRGTAAVITKERGAHREKRASRVREATMAVAGSSIAWTSMYGRWKVVPRIEGQQQACGRAEFFTIRP